MKKSFIFSGDHIWWGYTQTSHVKTSEPSTVITNSTDFIPSGLRSKVIKKDWNLYKCRTCNFITHAIYIKSGRKRNLLAIVTNQQTQKN